MLSLQDHHNYNYVETKTNSFEILYSTPFLHKHLNSLINFDTYCPLLGIYSRHLSVQYLLITHPSNQPSRLLKLLLIFLTELVRRDKKEFSLLLPTFQLSIQEIRNEIFFFSKFLILLVVECTPWMDFLHLLQECLYMTHLDGGVHAKY